MSSSLLSIYVQPKLFLDSFKTYFYLAISIINFPLLKALNKYVFLYKIEKLDFSQIFLFKLVHLALKIVKASTFLQFKFKTLTVFKPSLVFRVTAKKLVSVGSAVYWIRTNKYTYNTCRIYYM